VRSIISFFDFTERCTPLSCAQQHQHLPCTCFFSQLYLLPAPELPESAFGCLEAGRSQLCRQFVTCSHLQTCAAAVDNSNNET
jgi:hypothetical protein